ncbi:MAG: hypothetical protein AAF914_11545 [Pseudomonadota bacterium]
MRYLLSGLALLALAGCGERDPERADLLSIADGIYDAQIGTACLALRFRDRDRRDLSIDSTCDGAVDVTSDEVVVEADMIFVPGAAMTVTAVGPASFSGLWTQGETVTEVRFVRRDS